MWFPTSSKLFQGGFSVNVFMSTCFCVNPFLSEGWFVWGLGEWFALVGCGGSTGVLWGRKSLLNLQAVNLQLHWACEFSAGVFHVFCWGGLFTWFLCGPMPRRERVNFNLKTDPVTWLESMHMGERGRVYTCVYIYVCTQTYVSVSMWLFTCAFVHMRQNSF